MSNAEGITAEGCRARRANFLDAFRPLARTGDIVIADPMNLRYLANFHVDPFSLGADFGALLVIGETGKTTLYHDKRLPPSVQNAFVDERIECPWYDGQSAGGGPRRLAILEALRAHGGRIHDALNDPLGEQCHFLLAGLRRSKMPDEVAQLRECMRVGGTGMDWARANVRAGMSELDVYNGIFAACTLAAGSPTILYGDFAVSPGMARRGGMATTRVLHQGDMLILDFSVIRQGYRSDFTNTIVVGGQPSAEQTRLFDACVAAMAAGEQTLKAGASCQSVYDAVRTSFATRGLADSFPHHAGHGLGISHPEAPYFVKHSSETLIAGDVVTLEPGLYVDGTGGIRIEHNYLVTDGGFERLSGHTIALA
jgi:Xaa-Pro dipeptidase